MEGAKKGIVCISLWCLCLVVEVHLFIAAGNMGEDMGKVYWSAAMMNLVRNWSRLVFFV